MTVPVTKITVNTKQTEMAELMTEFLLKMERTDTMVLTEQMEMTGLMTKMLILRENMMLTELMTKMMATYEDNGGDDVVAGENEVDADDGAE